MTIVLTVTVCFSILATGATVAIIEIRDPTTDTTTIVQALTSLISAILGALLGLLAGKGEAASMHDRPDGSTDDL